MESSVRVYPVGFVHSFVLVHSAGECLAVDVAVRDTPLPVLTEPSESDAGGLGLAGRERLGRHRDDPRPLIGAHFAPPQMKRARRSATSAGVCPSHVAARSRTGTWNRSQSAIS